MRLFINVLTLKILSGRRKILYKSLFEKILCYTKVQILTAFLTHSTTQHNQIARMPNVGY